MYPCNKQYLSEIFVETLANTARMSSKFALMQIHDAHRDNGLPVVAS